MDENPTTEQPELQLQAPEIGPEVGMPEKLSQLRQKLNWNCAICLRRAVPVDCLHESRMREIFMSGSTRGEWAACGGLFAYSTGWGFEP